MKFLLAILLFTGLLASGSNPELQSHSFSELDQLKATESRKVIVFIHTDWCKVCRQMENTTFQDEDVIKRLNQQFYFIDLNAEGQDDITYAGHTFRYKPTGGNTGVHELAEQLGTVEGKLSYPTIAVLNVQNELVFQHGGLMDSKEMLAVLQALE